MENLINILWDIFKIVGILFLIIILGASLINFCIITPIKKRKFKNSLKTFGEELSKEIDKMVEEGVAEISKEDNKPKKNTRKTKKKEDK